MNLTNGATFLMALIKRAKTRFNFKNLCDSKRHIQEIAINNGWNMHIFQILREKRDGNFIFTGNLLREPPKPVKLSHEWIKKIFKVQEPEFNLDCLLIQKTDPLNPLLDVQRHILIKIST